MKLKELQSILFKSSSSRMRIEGEKAFNSGLVIKIKTKKIEDLYHIYGCVTNSTKSSELNTYIKIDIKKKKLDSIKCTCEDFKELSTSGYLFMCSHLTATAYNFFSLASKNNDNKNEKTHKIKENSLNKQGTNNIIKLVRIVSKIPTYYEAQYAIGKEKIKIKPNDLRLFLDGINDKKIKLNHDSFEFEAPIVNSDLPLSFTLKKRNDFFVITTHKRFPVSLNDQNSVYLFNWMLYLPSKNQIDKYNVLCGKLRENGEILYHVDIQNYDKLITFLSSISSDISISDEVKTFAAKYIKPEFYIYQIGKDIYCDINVIYGNKKINILKDNKFKNNIIRNYKKEDRIFMELERFRFIKRDERLLFIGGDIELFDILSRSENNLHSIGNVTFGNGLKQMNIFGSNSIKAEIKYSGGCYDFSYKIYDIENGELNDAFASYKQNERFYKTNNNNFLDFKDDGVRNFFNLIGVLNTNEKIETSLMQLGKAKALYLENIIKEKHLQFIKGAKLLENIEDSYDYLNNLDISLPITLNATLRKYQIDGFKWLKSLSILGLGGILADEMGLGKTIQIIAFLLSQQSKKSIIISPTSLIYNWKAEIEKFAPSLRVAIVHGVKRQRLKLITSLEDYDIILTTYGTLRMDIKLYENINFENCIIDEAQNIKNYLAQNAKIIKSIKAKVRFALTGTPIENNLTELWSIFDFVIPEYLFTREVFESKFTYGKKIHLEELKSLIKPFLLRRTKKEVLKELPDKIEKVFLVEMTTVQKGVYKSYIKLARDKIKNDDGGKIEVFSYLTRLRQICLDPAIVLTEYEGGSGKLKIATQLIQKHLDGQGKVLLFSQFTSVLKNIGKDLVGKGISYFYLDGKTKSKDRIKLVNEFNDSPDKKVFLISLKAGGTGLNLTSANLVIHFDPWWNPAVENQATDRAHRIGQRNIVQVIKLVAKGTIEEKIILLQENKKDLIDSVITGELTNSNALGKLTKEELLEIFRF
ncbi:SNF2 helicase associated domain-containing protein [Clostridium algoriphilum]|uniref:DEAD/DEAH box helicase n=1 Tax=Clostridium algoriphilum TaxID=198347 RepID=UPI001CF2505B|nr:SNF2-related protein [Clostridium algoriphilum]MCB2294684.1 SNF2 helicase associated domain-containing protein [Clostridium algoriphilum]